MKGVIAVRRETKSPWERRAPLTPEMTRHLVTEADLEILVQPSGRRVFHDKEYVRAGAVVTENLDRASVVMGVKEVPPHLFEPDTAYIFFSHVIKGQAYNMPMLARMMELGCTLIDYEKVRDQTDRRLIFFGRFAGLAGMIDSLWALGARLAHEGIRTPLAALEPSHHYDSLQDAKDAIRAAGEIIARDGLPAQLAPLVVGIAGYGNVATGVREILTELPTREITPEELAELSSGASTVDRCVYQVTFREEHIVQPRSGARSFELQDYYQHPEHYQSCFAQYLPSLTVLMNCNYWDERYPRLVTKEQLRALYSAGESPRLRLIGDLGCDIEGSVECTLKCTEPGDPIYVWDPATDQIDSGVSGTGPVVLAVDILPSELPREASEEFSATLQPFVAALARADYSAPFEQLDLPPEIKRAVIVHRGKLAPDFEYIQEHLDQVLGSST